MPEDAVSVGEVAAVPVAAALPLFADAPRGVCGLELVAQAQRC